MEVIVVAIVGVIGPLLGALVGAYVSGLATLRAAEKQSRRERRVRIYTDLLPDVIPDLEAGYGTAADARKIVERVVLEAAATSSDDRAHARAALACIGRAEQAEARYEAAQRELQTADTDALRQAMSAAEADRVQEIAEAGDCLRDYLAWLDGTLG